ncbi:hypothetical protein HWV62_34707 [Athelia sp. TMB]|nr:hypothetical protein HWV62_34707 [Athelia sp. TMB]
MPIVNLLDSLEAFLSTFQKDLSAVSGQISELQERSKGIDNRLKSRRKIEKPLSNLLSDVTVPPTLATLILDTPVSEKWLPAMVEFEHRLDTLRARSRVKAARDLGEVAEGLRIVASTKLRAFFLAMLQPIRTSVTTNMQVLQSSIFLKYKALFSFLQRQASPVAQELQRAYVSAARTYYETGFRRYSRSLSWIKARTMPKPENIVASEKEREFIYDPERIAYAKIQGPGVTLAFQADDKNYKEPIEALVRSIFLVLMDNATSEYTFITTFFAVEPALAPAPSREPSSSSSMFTPNSMLSPSKGGFDDRRSTSGSDAGFSPQTPRPRVDSFATSVNLTPRPQSYSQNVFQTDRSVLDSLWKQVMDPILEYCQTFVKSTLEPAPPLIPLLTMIRLVEDVVAEVQRRDCPPLENYVFALRLQMWPVFQKAISEQIEALKKLAEGTTTGYFGRSVTTTDLWVSSVSLHLLCNLSV